MYYIIFGISIALYIGDELASEYIIRRKQKYLSFIHMSVVPASEIPKLIHYRVVLFHTPDSGLTYL